MKIFISPIGGKTEHVKGWLAEESRGVQILWLIHSKKGTLIRTEKGMKDAEKIAKKLKTDLKSAYPRLKIKLKTIDSALEIDSTMDAIAEIIHKEMDDGNALLKSEFTLNITGGTNVMAAATMISATWYGTKAHYVLEPQPEDPEDKQYVLDLPVKGLNMARTKDMQLTILKIISESNYFIENTPKGINQEDREITKGSITRTKLLEKINNLKENKKKNIRIEHSTKELEKDGYIESVRDVKQYVYKDRFGKEKVLKQSRIQKDNDKYFVEIKTKNGSEFIEWPLKTRISNKNAVRYKITPAGIRTARESIMFD